MDVAVSDIIDRIVRFGRSDPDKTERFAALEPEKHLVPGFQRQLERVLESFGKFAPIVYKTHCLQDDGLDIVVRLSTQDGDATALIGFQIKAERDFLDAALLKTLKTQHYDAMQIAGLQQYYILLCVYEGHHKERLATIASKFKRADRTKIIEPTVADVFFSLSQERIDAYIKRSLTDGDIIQKKALTAVQSLTPMASALVIYLAVHAYIEGRASIDTSDVNNSGTLRDFHRFVLAETAKQSAVATTESSDDNLIEFEEPEVCDDFEAEILRDIETIQDQIVTVDGDSLTVIFEQVAPIVALGTDALVRYDYNADEITVYLFDLLGLYD